MKRDEYLKSAFEKFNSGEISEEAYDAILMNMDEFVDEDSVPKYPSVDEDLIYVAVFNHSGSGSELLNSYAKELEVRFSKDCAVSLVNGDTLCFRGLTGAEISDLMEAIGADYNYSYSSPEEAWTTDAEYETNCRYFVYDQEDNVISDGFQFIDDAREFMNERENACIIKAHNYYRDELGKLQPDGYPEIVDTSAFVQIAYVKYKENWCKQRGIKLEELDEEIGINGECYVSFEEFLDNEFRDEEYMKHLLDSEKDAVAEPSLSQSYKKYRVVWTCLDSYFPAYAESHEKLWDSEKDAFELAKTLATEECTSLNGVDGTQNSDSVVGCYEVDDCANNDYEVRWYEKKPEERDEGSCDIEYVTTYNVYPVEFEGSDYASCKYRGFELKSEGKFYKIFKDGVCFGTGDGLFGTFIIVDDICLECAKDKTCALEAVHKVPLDVIIKFAAQRQETEKSSPHKLEQDVGER